MQCEFKGAGEKLAGKIYGQEAWTLINHLEARHRLRSRTMAMRASCPWVSEFARVKQGFSTASTPNRLCCRDHLFFSGRAAHPLGAVSCLDEGPPDYPAGI